MPHRCLKLRDDTPAAAKHTFPRTPATLRAISLLFAAFLVFDVWFPSGHFHEQRQHSGRRSHQQSDLHRNGVYGILLVQDFPCQVPLTLSDNMDILMDRTDGNESATFSYLIRYNYTNNAIEFVTHGASF